MEMRTLSNQTSTKNISRKIVQNAEKIMANLYLTVITDDTAECTTNQTQIQGLDLEPGKEIWFRRVFC